MKHAIEVSNVNKRFGDLQALVDVSLIAKQGKVTGLLGPNGAGKSTLIKAMTTLSEVDSGSIMVDGVDVLKNPEITRERIGLAGQFSAIDDFLTGRETLEMVSRLYGLSKSEAKQRSGELLEKLGLGEAADRQAKTYSGGMRRRLDLGASLVATPKVLFLDEPTTGLDPRTRLQLWDIIRDLISQGVTILLTTQYLEEADTLCDHIYVIDKGRMIIEGTSSELKSSLGKDIIELKVPSNNQKQTTQILQNFSSTLVVDEFTGKFILKTSNGSDDLLRVAELLKQNDIKCQEISLHRPTLDEVFLEVTGAK